MENLNIDDYLIGVVSSEVPVYFEEEALKAQAVASRTYALKQMENNKDKNYDVTSDIMSQVFSTNDELKEKWKEVETNRIRDDIICPCPSTRWTRTYKIRKVEV